MEFIELVKNRFSCKNFSDKKVEDEKLDLILQAGRFAPTAKNKQIQRIYVCKSEKALLKVDDLTPCRYKAPLVLLVAYDESEAFVYPGGKYNSGAEDASIVASHMIWLQQALEWILVGLIFLILIRQVRNFLCLKMKKSLL